MDNDLLGRQSAKAEAWALLPLIGKNGDTVETLRALIAIPPRFERALRAYAERHPEESRQGGETLRRCPSQPAPCLLTDRQSPLGKWSVIKRQSLAHCIS